MLMAESYLRYIVNEIHTTIVATVDDEGLPVTAAIDMMDAEAAFRYARRAASMAARFPLRSNRRIACIAATA